MTDRIAVGGMAEVFRALMPQSAGSARAVVIKKMLPDLAKRPDSAGAFQHEAMLGRCIRHPNVVEVIDSGINDGAPYIVLEYVFGVDLRRVQRYLQLQGESLAPPLALFLSTQMLDGLTAVHEATDRDGRELGVVHRDVSPSNLFLSVHGEVKLGDLGIAQAGLREEPGMSLREAKGKLGYTAPESLRDDRVGQAADVFAAAVVTAELLLGRALFAGATELAVLLAIRDGEIGALDEIGNSVGADIVDALRAALRADPAERTRSAKALRDQLATGLVTPVAQLRRDLGTLVARAMDAGPTANLDRGALARTVEASTAELMSMPLPRATPRRGSIQADAANELKTPVRDALSDATNDTDRPTSPPPSYELRSNDVRSGPMSYAELVAKLVSEDVVSNAEVKKNGEGWQTLGTIPELAAHLGAAAKTPTRKRVQLAQTTELHDLGNVSVVEVLAQACVRRVNGLLLFERDGVRKEVYLHEGAPTYVSSNRSGELLGHSLVADGLVGQADLDRALSQIPRYNGRLGETLVALGLVQPIPLVRHLSRQVKEKLLGLFVWNHGRVAFYEDVSPPDRAFRLDLNVWETMLEGIAKRVAAGSTLTSPPGRSRLKAQGLDPEHWKVPTQVREVWTQLAEPKVVASFLGEGETSTPAYCAIHLLLALDALGWVA